MDFLNMDFIESSLCRLRGAVSWFVGPSVDLWDGSAIKAQFKLRQRPLRDVEVIRCRQYFEVGRKRNEFD